MSRDKLFCGRTSCLCSLLRQTSGDMIHIHLSIGRRPICPFIWDTWALGHSLLLPSQKPWLFFFSVACFLQGAGHISQRCGIRTTTKQQGELAEVLQTPVMRCYSLVLVTGCHQKKNIHRSPKGMDEVSDNTKVVLWCLNDAQLVTERPESGPRKYHWQHCSLNSWYEAGQTHVFHANLRRRVTLLPRADAGYTLKNSKFTAKNCINVPLNSCAR